MPSVQWPAGPRQNVGDEADLLNLVTERFARRLIEESAVLRSDTWELRNQLRADMKVVRADIIAETRNTRDDLIKCALVLWAGQLATFICLMILLR